MKCPVCNWYDTRVINSRDRKNTRTLYRRRKCTQCGHRFSTYEFTTGEIVDVAAKISAEWKKQVISVTEFVSKDMKVNERNVMKLFEKEK